MSSRVHSFDAREGGAFRISLTYDDPTGMTISYTLTDADGGTLVTGVHEDVPPGVPPAANEVGWNMSLDKLAALVAADG